MGWVGGWVGLCVGWGGSADALEANGFFCVDQIVVINFLAVCPRYLIGDICVASVAPADGTSVLTAGADGGQKRAMTGDDAAVECVDERVCFHRVGGVGCVVSLTTAYCQAFRTWQIILSKSSKSLILRA